MWHYLHGVTEKRLDEQNLEEKMPADGSVRQIRQIVKPLWVWIGETGKLRMVESDGRVASRILFGLCKRAVCAGTTFRRLVVRMVRSIATAREPSAASMPVLTCRCSRRANVFEGVMRSRRLVKR